MWLLVVLISAAVGIATWVVGRKLLRLRHSLSVDVGAVSPDWLSRQRGQRGDEFP